MFRVFDAGRCPPPSELAVFIARKRVLLPAGRIAIRTSLGHSFPFRCSSKNRNFSVLLQCDEKPLPNINGFVGSIGQPVRH
jgi:hypothetical protein